MLVNCTTSAVVLPVQPRPKNAFSSMAIAERACNSATSLAMKHPSDSAYTKCSGMQQQLSHLALPVQNQHKASVNPYLWLMILWVHLALLLVKSRASISCVMDCSIGTCQVQVVLQLAGRTQDAQGVILQLLHHMTSHLLSLGHNMKPVPHPEQ